MMPESKMKSYSLATRDFLRATATLDQDGWQMRDEVFFICSLVDVHLRIGKCFCLSKAVSMRRDCLSRIFSWSLNDRNQL
jgi:hypothetical protein